jgi:GNAT superfamily N-acetyltransferase
MEFRKADFSELDSIMKIVHQAQSFLKKLNINQWQNGYPTREIVAQDIANGNAYLLTDDSKVMAVVTILFAREPTYDVIYEGKWLTEGEYSVVHRLAVDSHFKGKGIATGVLEEIDRMTLQKGIHSIKVDTHEDNIPMQKLLKKNGFVYCGVIYLADGNKRIAFEKLLQDNN